MKCDSQSSFLARTFASPCLGHEPKVKVVTYDSNEEIEVGIDSEWIIENLCPCDNVVVPTSIDEPFWFLLVNKGSYTIDTSFNDEDDNDEDGNVWTKDVVVHGFWY